MSKVMMNMEELEQVNGGFVDEVVDGIEWTGDKIIDGIKWVNNVHKEINNKINEIGTKIGTKIGETIRKWFF